MPCIETTISIYYETLHKKKVPKFICIEKCFWGKKHAILF